MLSKGQRGRESGSSFLGEKHLEKESGHEGKHHETNVSILGGGKGLGWMDRHETR